MTRPEEALEQARVAVAQARAAGRYGPDEGAGAMLSPALTAGAPGRIPRRLLEWAMIDPDLSRVRSTRRFGAPIAAVKRLLLRLLIQYHDELISQQTRFNVHIVRYVAQLEERVEELERARRLDEPSP